VDATETLVVERADGELLFGYDEFVADGETTRIPVTGSMDLDGEGFVLTEEGGFFAGRVVDDDTIAVRFVRVDAEYTTFEVELRRQ
jgi:hypothetical protein